MSTGPASVARPRSRWARIRASDIFYSFKRSPMTMVAALVTLIFIVGAVFAPVLAQYAVLLGPPEYFMLMVLAFTTVSAVLGKSALRGMTALFIGLAVGLVGLDRRQRVQVADRVQQRLRGGVVRAVDAGDAAIERERVRRNGADRDCR